MYVKRLGKGQVQVSYDQSQGRAVEIGRRGEQRNTAEEELQSLVMHMVHDE